MTHLRNLTAFMLLVLLSVSCKDKDETPKAIEKGKILVDYPWRMSTVTDLNGTVITTNKLNAQTQAIGNNMDIQFLQNNVTKAIDRDSKQVVNGGTWYLKNNDQTLDISISGFAGQFTVVELSSAKMRLQSKMPVSGVEQETIMVFQPVVR